MNKIITINNFKFILNNNKKAKITQVDAYINNGCIFENKKNVGISHLLEHVIMDSWEKCDNGCNDYWKKRGIVSNASTGMTFVNYFIRGLEKYTYEMLDYIISICISPIITKKRIEKEKNAVLNELLINDNDPNIAAYNLLNKMLFNNEGLMLQDDIQLQINNLKEIKKQDLQKWTKKYYSQGNIIFIITGNFNKKKVKQFIKKKVDTIKNFVCIVPPTNVFIPQFKLKYIKGNTKNTTIFFTIYSKLSQRDKEINYIKLLNGFLGTQMTSFLFNTLREKLKLIYSINFDYYIQFYGSFFVIQISTENKNIEKVIFNTIKIFKDLLKGNFTEKYLNYVKETCLVSYYSRSKNIINFNEYYGEQIINQIYNIDDLHIFSHEEIIDFIKQVTKPKFIEYLKKVLIFDNLKIVYQGKKEVKNLPLLAQQRI
jgi:predicted Zn-dependent peptidase